MGGTSGVADAGKEPGPIKPAQTNPPERKKPVIPELSPGAVDKFFRLPYHPKADEISRYNLGLPGSNIAAQVTLTFEELNDLEQIAGKIHFQNAFNKAPTPEQLMLLQQDPDTLGEVNLSIPLVNGTIVTKANALFYQGKEQKLVGISRNQFYECLKNAKSVEVMSAVLKKSDKTFLNDAEKAGVSFILDTVLTTEVLSELRAEGLLAEAFDPVEIWSVALSTARLCERSGVEFTGSNSLKIRHLYTAIGRIRQEIGNQPVVPETHADLISIVCEEYPDNGALAGSRFHDYWGKYGNDSKVYAFGHDKSVMLEAITQAEGPLFIGFNGHGHSDELIYRQQGDFLKVMTLEDVGQAILGYYHNNKPGTPPTLCLDSCYSYDFAQNLYEHLHTRLPHQVPLPRIIVAANRNQVSFLSVDILEECRIDEQKPGSHYSEMLIKLFKGDSKYVMTDLIENSYGSPTYDYVFSSARSIFDSEDMAAFIDIREFSHYIPELKKLGVDMARIKGTPFILEID